QRQAAAEYGVATWMKGGRRASRRRYFAAAISGKGRVDRQLLSRSDLKRSRDILQAVCSIWAVTLEDLQSKSRRPSIVEPRHAAMATIAGLCQGLSLFYISSLLGRRCHTVVLHACRAHDRRLQTDTIYAARLAELQARLASTA